MRDQTERKRPNPFLILLFGIVLAGTSSCFHPSGADSDDDSGSSGGGGGCQPNGCTQSFPWLGCNRCWRTSTDCHEEGIPGHIEETNPPQHIDLSRAPDLFVGGDGDIKRTAALLNLAKRTVPVHAAQSGGGHHLSPNGGGVRACGGEGIYERDRPPSPLP